MVVEKKADLRYGENPHQLGAFYTDPAHAGGSISAAHQIAGKDLSFNNLLDLDAAWSIASDFKTPAVCIVKHGNPCGLAIVVDLAEAFRLALEGDSVSRLRRDHRREPDHRRRRPPAPSGPASSRPSWRPATRPRRSRSCARSAASRSSRCRRPTPTATSWASAGSTSSASAAGCWSRPSTRWRRTATSSRPSRSGARPSRS